MAQNKMTKEEYLFSIMKAPTPFCGTTELEAEEKEFNSGLGIRLNTALVNYRIAKSVNATSTSTHWAHTFNSWHSEKAKRTADLLLMINIADAELLDLPISYTAVLARFIGQCEAELRQNGDL